MVVRSRSMEEDAAAHEGSACGPEPLFAQAGDQLLPVGAVARLEEKNDGRVPQRAGGRKTVMLDGDPVRPLPRARGEQGGQGAGPARDEEPEADEPPRAEQPSLGDRGEEGAVG